MQILLVEDEAATRKSFRRMLKVLPDLEVIEAGSLADALTVMRREPIDLFLVDLRLSQASNDRGGLEFLQELRRAKHEAPCVVLSGVDDMGDVREAFRLGARDYVLKRELGSSEMAGLVESFRRRPAHDFGPTRGVFAHLGLLGTSPPMERLRRRIARFAAVDVPVFISGAPGTGKDLVAYAIHDASRRRDGPLVVVSCTGALPSMIDQAIAHPDLVRGTLVLNEVGDLSSDSQALLLRAFENGTLGSEWVAADARPRPRIIVTSRVDLGERVGFRAELRGHLEVVALEVPSLADRVDDIPELARAFAGALPRKLQLTDDAIALLKRRAWSGNVRELCNAIVELALLAERDVVDAAAIREHLTPAVAAPRTKPFDQLVEEILNSKVGEPKLRILEGVLVRRALEVADGNKSKAARLLGMNRMAYERKLARVDDCEPKES